MTNHAELIAEAEKARDAVRRFAEYSSFSHSSQDFHVDGIAIAETFHRLAAALRECAVPEGWAITECCGYGHKRVVMDGDAYLAQNRERWMVDEDDNLKRFPTASAAMAALDGGE